MKQLFTTKELAYLARLGIELNTSEITLFEKKKQTNSLTYGEITEIELTETAFRKHRFFDLLQIFSKINMNASIAPSAVYAVFFRRVNEPLVSHTLADFDLIQLTYLVKKMNNAVKMNDKE